MKARKLSTVLLRAVGGLLAALLANSVVIGEVLRTDVYDVAITNVASDLVAPWSFALLPDGDILISERPGRLRVVHRGRVLETPVSGLPAVTARGQGGLLDVVPHPEYLRNRRIYWTFSAAEADTNNVGTEVASGMLRCRVRECALTDVRVLFRQSPKVDTALHFGSRLAFDHDGYLFITLGERGQEEQAQNLGNHLGKVLRLTDTGTVPSDNPFVARLGARPEIFSYGHRNVQGAAVHPVTGRLWTHEHGPQGGDEMNIITAGANYGWPVITFGRTYVKNEPIGAGTERADIAPAQRTWVPSVAPSGLTFYTGQRFQKWRGNVLIGTLREQRLIRLILDGDRVIGEERIAGLGRIRTVRESRDGSVLVLSESRGALLRLAPVKH